MAHGIAWAGKPANRSDRGGGLPRLPGYGHMARHGRRGLAATLGMGMSAEAAAPKTGPSATPAGQAGWVSYELAGGPYFNIVKIFVFAPFFAASFIGDDVRGQELWGYIEGAAGFLIALSAILLGPAVDFYGARKPAMAAGTLAAAASMAMLWLAAPGSPLLPIAIALIGASLFAEIAYVYHNSLLPFVAKAGRVGLLSGIGYSAGYLGTLIVFVPYLLFVGFADPPPFGLDRASGETERIVGPITALWFLAFAVPFFLFTPDVPRNGVSFVQALALGQRQLLATLRRASHYRNIIRFLLVRMIYADGLTATFAFVGIYAAGNFGWSPALVGVYGLLIFSVMIFSGVIGGLVDDAVGSKRTIVASLIFFTVSLAFSFGIRPDQLTYGVPYVPAEGDALPLIGGLLAALGFTTLPEQIFVLNGVAGGLCVSPVLSSSRVMLTRIAPPSMIAEFFGLYTLTGRATAFVAPLAIAALTSATQDQRAGFAVVFVFLIAGLVGMAIVREEPTAASH